MGSLGWPEILIILVIALIIFGPRKLPELGKTLGQSLAQFRRASEDFKRTWEQEVELEKQRLDAPPPTPVDYSSSTNPYEGQDFSLDGSHSASSDEAKPHGDGAVESPAADLGTTAPSFLASESAEHDSTVHEAAAPGSEGESEKSPHLEAAAVNQAQLVTAPVEGAKAE